MAPRRMADRDLTWTITHRSPHVARVPDLVVRARTAAGVSVEAPLGVHALVIGKGEDCDIVLDDPKISRRHCELRLTEGGVVLRDLGSKNGTFAGVVEVREAVLAPGTAVTAGASEISVVTAGEPTTVALSVEARFGAALGGSLVMRELFERLRRAAPTDATVLLLGESGTGKELLARGLHEHSARRTGPFVIVDCAAVEKSFLADELFGHERGAFTGADKARRGLLAEADGGTLFIDEVGELPLDLQVKLLRALEDRTYQPLGGAARRPFDARIVAATHRNLRARAKSGELREDLYYRLAELEVRVPPLRDRREDIPLLLREMLSRRTGGRAPEIGSDMLAVLHAHDWPGNVRELRNIAARLALFPELPLDLSASGEGGDAAEPSSPISPHDLGLLELSLHDARKSAIASFERRYIEAALARAGGNVTQAAKRMDISRQRLHEMMDQHGLRRRHGT